MTMEQLTDQGEGNVVLESGLTLSREDAARTRSVFDQAGSLSTDLGRTMNVDTKISIAKLLATEADSLINSGVDLRDSQAVESMLQEKLKDTPVLPDELMNLGWDNSKPTDESIDAVKSRLPGAIRHVAMTSQALGSSDVSLLDSVTKVSDLAKAELSKDGTFVDSEKKRKHLMDVFTTVIDSHTQQDDITVESAIQETSLPKPIENKAEDLSDSIVQVNEIVDKAIAVMGKKTLDKQQPIVDYYKASYDQATQSLVDKWQRYLESKKRGNDTADIILLMRELEGTHVDELHDAPFFEDYRKHGNLPRAEEGTADEQFVVTGAGWSETRTFDQFRQEGNVNPQAVEYFHNMFLNQMTTEFLGKEYLELRREVMRGEYHGGGQYHEESRQLQFIPTKVPGVYMSLDFENPQSAKETHSIKFHYTFAYLSSLLQQKN